MDEIDPRSMEELLQTLVEELTQMEPEDLRVLEEEIAWEKIHNKTTITFLKLREERGWGKVNEMIRQAPYCPHEEKIVISSCCPICKKIEHNNSGCYACTTSEDLENDLEIYGYDPRCVYFVKKLCKACKTWERQNRTSAAA